MGQRSVGLPLQPMSLLVSACHTLGGYPFGLNQWGAGMGEGCEMGCVFPGSLREWSPGAAVPEACWGHPSPCPTGPMLVSVPLLPALVPTPSDPGPALLWQDPHLTHIQSEPRLGLDPQPLGPQSHFYFHHLNFQQVGASGHR